MRFATAIPSVFASSGGDLIHHGLVPPTDEHRGDGADLRIETSGDASFDPAHVGMCRRQVLLVEEQQRDVHGHARSDRCLDGRRLLQACRES